MIFNFSSTQRDKKLKEMERKEFDVLIIGGGITGAGVALDAQSRGMNTALVEMQDFAAGTSSRSTKLVHGGLRYLKQLEISLVAEVGKERAIVYENGPHVTTPEWMLLPIYKNGTFGKFSTSIGLKVYDFLARVKRIERRKMLPIKEALIKEPLLKKDDLKGAGYYVEYRSDDARLTIEVLKEAVNKGTIAVNYTKVEEFIYKDGKVIGLLVVDQISKKSYRVYAKKIVNAAGPWVDRLREKDGSKSEKTLQLTKGAHLVFDESRFPLQQAVYFDTPDGRMIFAIPREGKTYVGTTDTVYQGDIVHPRLTISDRSYILNAVNYMFPTVKITEQDIESSWAGLRPLIHENGKDPSEISRKDEVWHSESGLITIAGGKLTGYRKMAEEVVNLVSYHLQKDGYGTYLSCQTKSMPISGGDVGGSTQFPNYMIKKAEEGIQFGFTRDQAEKLVHTYGSNIDRIYKLMNQYGHEAKEYGLPNDLFVSLLYGIHEEMVTKPIDFFIRRTGALFFDYDLVQSWKGKVIDYMSMKLKWEMDQKQMYAEELEKHLHDARIPSDAPNPTRVKII